MHSFYPALFVFYALPFLILFAIPSWRWLTIVGTIATLGLWWCWRSVLQDDGNGIGAVLAVGFIMIMALGVFAGALGRALLLSRKFRIRHATLIVGLATFVAVPAVGWSWQNHRMAAQRARWAPPSRACQSKLFRVQIGGQQLGLPIMRGISVGQGREYESTYLFDIGEQARHFCELASDAPFEATNLHLDFYRGFSPSPGRQREAICDRLRAQAWWPALCQPKGYPAWPVQNLTLFDPARYDAARMIGAHVDEGAYVARYYPAARWHRDGAFEAVAADGGTIYRRGTSPGDYHARCSPGTATAPDDLSCAATSMLRPGLALNYVFRGDRRHLFEDFETRDREVRAIAESLIGAASGQAG